MLDKSSFASDMASFKIYYESQLEFYKRRYCADCKFHSCVKCQHGSRIRELDENIRFCEREISRDQYDKLIIQRRKKYKNTMALCDTNIRTGDGTCNKINSYLLQRRWTGGILGGTRLG